MDRTAANAMRYIFMRTPPGTNSLSMQPSARTPPGAARTSFMGCGRRSYPHSKERGATAHRAKVAHRRPRKVVIPWPGRGRARSSGTKGPGRPDSMPPRFCRPARHAIRHTTGPLLTGHHGDGLTLQIDIGLAAHVHRDALDGPTAEGPGRRARVVRGHRLAAVAPHVQALAANGELSWLRLDRPCADLAIAEVEREGAARHSQSLLALLLEGCRQNHVRAAGDLLG